MASRILLSGVVGGLIIFMWGFVSHMVLPLGDVGIKQFKDDAPIIEALKANVTEPGFYFFPGMAEETPDMSGEQREKLWNDYAAKLRVSPNGVLIYDPDGDEMMSPAQLGTEFGTNAVSAFLVAWLLSRALGRLRTYGCRVLFVTVAGLFAAVAVEVPYWNWYGFPIDYIGAAMLGHVVGFLLAGLALAAIIKPKAEVVSP